ncbi:hypothetical protein LCGC14_1425120, partial [marine sediment metagenome]
TMTVSGDIAESTVMTNTWKSWSAGFIDVVATVEANAMTEGTIKVGTNANLDLYVNSTKYFRISTAVCIEQTETVNMNDVGKISYSFVGDDTEGPIYL